ncbi:uncharacterized protein F54H12.2 [Trichonephila clavipes]|nr:uncharacterized protein F54H12.2 [Trichonephila clavipes]
MEKRGQRLDPNDCIGYYCKQQIGSGSYFASNYPIQRGYGLFNNLRRYAMPIMMKAGKYLGKHLLSTAATGDYRLQIENISIYVRKCEISSSILVAHEKALEQSLIQMPLRRIEVKTFTVSSGLKSVIIPNGVNGVLPSQGDNVRPNFEFCI